jgi:hypothetical protein
MSMAVDRGVVGKAEFARDAVGTAPAEVGVFDVFTVLAAADTALAAVTGRQSLLF